MSPVVNLLNMSLLVAQNHKNASHIAGRGGKGKWVNPLPSQHRFMTYHDGGDNRHYVDFVGTKVDFSQVCKIASLTNVSGGKLLLVVLV